jgi:hypothetical protein
MGKGQWKDFRIGALSKAYPKQKEKSLPIRHVTLNPNIGLMSLMGVVDLALGEIKTATCTISPLKDY